MKDLCHTEKKRFNNFIRGKQNNFTTVTALQISFKNLLTNKFEKAEFLSYTFSNLGIF